MVPVVCGNCWNWPDPDKRREGHHPQCPVLRGILLERKRAARPGPLGDAWDDARRAALGRGVVLPPSPEN